MWLALISRQPDENFNTNNDLNVAIQGCGSPSATLCGSHSPMTESCLSIDETWV